MTDKADVRQLNLPVWEVVEVEVAGVAEAADKMATSQKKML